MKFKNDIEAQAGFKDAEGDLGIAGQLLSSTGTETNWIDQSTIASGSAEVVDIKVKNISAANGGINLSKGDPVYIYGSVGASARLYVDLADADSTATNNLGDGKMPCVGLLDQDLSPNGEGTATVVGKLRNLITNPIDGDVPNENDTVYVKSGGGLTLTKPTGSTNLIQNVGQVGRVSTSADGNIVVAALLRSNDVPNLPEGRIWIGDGNTIVSDTVYVDEPNNRVGIGTTSPGEKLQVNGNIKISGPDFANGLYIDSEPMITYSSVSYDTMIAGTAIRVNDFTKQMNFKVDGNNDFLSHDGNTGRTIFSYSGSEKMRIEGGGNVGIGTTSPAKKLTIGNIGVGNTDGLKIEDPGNTSYGAHYSYNDASSTVEIGGVTNNVLNDCISIAREATRTITINTSENVGIGITNPSHTLEVAGTVQIKNGGSGYLYFHNTNNFIYGDQYNSLRAYAGDNFRIVTNSGERMRILNNGNVGIGTTNPPSKLSVSGGTLSVSGNGAGFGVVKLGDPTDPNPYVGIYRSAAAAIATSGNFLNLGGYDGIAFTTGAAQLSGQIERMRILSNGNVGIGTTVANVRLEIGGGSTLARVIPSIDNQGYIGDSQHRWQAIYATNGTIQTSDIREKTEIKPTELGLDFINDLKPVSYKWAEGERLDASKDERNHQGLIAQEVAETLEKHGIDKNKFGGLDIQKTDEYDDFHAMSYEQLIAPMIKSIQELKAEIEELKKQINK